MPVFRVACGVDFTRAQYEVLYWARLYNKIAELPAGERPTEGVINSDRDFDNWLTNYMKDREQEDLRRFRKQQREMDKAKRKSL